MIGTAGLRDDRVPKRGVDAGACAGEGVRSHRVGWMEGTRWAATFVAVVVTVALAPAAALAVTIPVTSRQHKHYGKDKLFGGSGKDTLRGGSAKDKLSRGPGKDSEKQ